MNAVACPPFATVDRDGDGNYVITAQFDHADGGAEVGHLRISDLSMVRALGRYLLSLTEVAS